MSEVMIASSVIHWVVTLVLIVVNYALVRQVGILYERVASAGALMIGGKYKVGDYVPPLHLDDLNGNTVWVGGKNVDDRSTMVFFLSPSCPICKTLLPVLKSMQKSERAWLSVVLASDDDPNEQHRLIEEQKLGNFSYVLSPELGLKFEVGKLPYAVLIDGQGILKSNGLVNSREHLESLIEAKNQGVVSLQQFLDEKLVGKTA